MSEEEEILQITKITLVVSLVIGSWFSILYWMPEISLPFFGVEYSPEAGALSMLLGCAMSAINIGSLFGLLAKEWYEVRILMMMEIVWTTLALLVVMINFGTFGVNAPLALILYGLVLAMLVVSYAKQQEYLR